MQLQPNHHPSSAFSYLQPRAALCHPRLEIQDLALQLNEAHYVFQLSVVGRPKNILIFMISAQCLNYQLTFNFYGAIKVANNIPY